MSKALKVVSIVTIGFAFGQLGVEVWAGDFPPIVNTQPAGEEPPSPSEAAKAITVPPGFRVSLFAGEPDVSQPISFSIDDRGRLWVAECYTYQSSLYTDELKDRLVILEDRDQDGQFDDRRVFWDEGLGLTSVTLGYGYVWILNGGRLQRIPDRDGDDRPDDVPETLLDGFNVQDIGHNIVNGLRWGPDGWLYGRHGITTSSYVGAPGTPQDARVPLNCCIWRYHPQLAKFEVVVNGTTNPWGLDYDEHGQFFFTNNVIGHLWHAVPGAHFQRMSGVDFNPYLYELMPQTADHYHWDAGQKWSDSRDGIGRHGELGGGHSHCGGMIYLGDNWPAKYRGSIFMCNTHGRRVNQNSLKRSGSGYVGERAADFLLANQPWFRGVELGYGPDGGVYVSDWTDLGECHDRDGVHRTSGRIYKVVYEPNWKPAKIPTGGLTDYSNTELLALQRHPNEWYVRHSRRILHERSLAQPFTPTEIAEMRKLLVSGETSALRLRGLWLLNLGHSLTEAELIHLLADADEHLVSWAIRLLTYGDSQTTTGSVSTAVEEALIALAAEPHTGLIATYLASAAQRLSPSARRQVAVRLAILDTSFVDDKLELLIWYAMEPTVATQWQETLEQLGSFSAPRMVQFAARRISEPWEENSRDALFANAYSGKVTTSKQILTGVLQALRGRRQVSAPAGWAEFARTADPSIRSLVDELQVVFGDGLTMRQLLALAGDSKRETDERRRALDVLIQNQVDGTARLLANLINDRGLAGTAVAGLANFNHPDTAKKILGRWRQLDRESRFSAVNTLASRQNSARELAAALASGAVTPEFVSAFQARRVRAYNDPEMNAILDQHWGQVLESSAAKKKLFADWRVKLTSGKVEAPDLAAGKLLFEKTCAKCHRLHGQGGNLGPDLTGANRDNLDYLLENVIDPSAVLAANFRMSSVQTVDGRVLSGVVVDTGGATVRMLTPEKELVIDRADIDVVKPTRLSLMPDGLLDNLQEDQVRDLIGFLRQK